MKTQRSLKYIIYIYKWKWKPLSRVWLFVTPRTVQSMELNNGVGSCSLLQGIFPTQGSNPGLPHCRWILYQLSHKGRPRILEWVASSFSSGSSWPRNRIGVSYIAGGFFTSWAFYWFLLERKSVTGKVIYFPPPGYAVWSFCGCPFFGHTTWQVQDLSFPH